MKLFKYIAFIILLGIITSCKKDFLDVEDQSSITRQQYVKDLKTLDEFMNGIYIMLTRDLYDAPNQVYPEIIADNIKTKTAGTRLINEYKWSQRSDASSTTFYYQYKIIKACNFVIENVAAYRNEAPSKADDLKAQAMAIRALVNFTLVNVYAQSYNFTDNASHLGIALTISADPFEPITKRNTVEEVYKAIIDDLNTAIPLFASEDVASALIINKVAAKGLLSRVLLFKGDYNGARNLATEVLAKVPIMGAAEYPANLFSYTETEALFQLLPASPAIVDGSFTSNFQGGYFQGFTFQIQYYATQDIATLLTQDPQDSRQSWVTFVSGNWRITKYPQDVIQGIEPVTQSYYPSILRSSEMCLTAAEASAKLNMEDDARTYLDAIRMRANPAASPTTATGNDLLELIYTERRKELAFEGLRMFDLLRWKKGVNRGADVTNGAEAQLPYPSNKAIAPIPLKDVQIIGLPQNPGYN